MKFLVKMVETIFIRFVFKEKNSHLMRPLPFIGTQSPADWNPTAKHSGGALQSP